MTTTYTTTCERDATDNTAAWEGDAAAAGLGEMRADLAAAQGRAVAAYARGDEARGAWWGGIAAAIQGEVDALDAILAGE